MQKLLRDIYRAGATIFLEDGHLRLEAGNADLKMRLREAEHELLETLMPSIADEQVAYARQLLEDMAGESRVVTSTRTAKKAVKDLLAPGTGIGLDIETAVNDQHRGPIPVKLTKSGTIAKRQGEEAKRALDPTFSRIRLVQASIEGLTVVFDIDHTGLDALAPLFAKNVPLAIHNGTFEAKFLLAAGVELRADIWDTMLAMRHLDGTMPGLAQACNALLGITPPKGFGASDWGAKQLSPEQIEYAMLDAVLARRLYEVQREMLDDVADEHDRRLQSHQLMCRSIVPTAAIMRNGISFDVESHARQMEKWHAGLIKARMELELITEGRVLETDEEVRRWIEEAADSKTLVLWERTKKTRKLSVASPILKLHRQLPGIKQLLEVRKYEKLISSFGPGLADKVNSVTNRIHPNLRLSGAITGRMSCSNPNVQQMPRSKEFRSLFCAGEGNTLVRADYSQIELRIAAELSGDENMRRAYKEKQDLHRWTGSLVTGKAPEDITDDERKVSKAQAFGLLYGASAKTFSRYARAQFGLEMNLIDAQWAKHHFFMAYPQLRAWQKRQTAVAKQRGFVETIDGRRWCWDWSAKTPEDIDDSIEPGSPMWWDQISGYRYTFCLNHPVQGSAAAVMMSALTNLYEALPAEAKLVAVVHDEVLVECPSDPALVRKVARITVREMTRAFRDLFPNAPYRGLVCPTAGPSWGEQTKIWWEHCDKEDEIYYTQYLQQSGAKGGP